MEEKKELVYLSYTEIQLLLEVLNNLAECLCPIQNVEDYQKIRRVWMLTGKLEGHKENIETLDSTKGG